MDKSKFLEILRQSLIGEIDSVEIDKNIKYYDQYISRQSSVEEEKIIDELGDPRLIAKSIIESNRAAKQKEGYSDRHSSNYDDSERYQDTQRRYHNVFYSNLKWYHKIALIIAFLLIIIIIAAVGQLLLRILFIFGLPIIILLLFVMLLRRR
ncbi:hypothetical protein H0486_01665 [Lachnospiraceae bacterium MD1]|uniref:DUF1700 domain-containing protein n=1 Tax=Variimorphobacter saccharofermentans TaxID=2755051 RepID=A0A839JY96_9FIRM|nr:DUF1700 domain-containing protein [Variimorphobacter saccharofermentans]MBB2181589.1 hypothetical protein [Variimorphobacter saccharofermentans]